MRRVAILSAFVALAAFGIGFASKLNAAITSHTVTEEHVVPFTVGGIVGAATITDADLVQHETITVTVTATAPPPPPPPTTTTEPPVNTPIWFAGHEGGNDGEWRSGPYESGPVPSGNCTTSVASGTAHTGNFALRQTINTSSESGCRQFRYEEIRDNVEPSGLYFSAWLYAPVRATVSGSFWNVFQFKTKNSSGSFNEVAWALDIVNRTSSGAMYLRPRWKGLFPGPQASDGTSRKTYENQLDLQPGRWTRIEAFLRQSAGYTGRFTFWQDSQLVLDIPSSRTLYDSGSDNRWSLNNYSDGLSPSSMSLFWDDATISRTRP